MKKQQLVCGILGLGFILFLTLFLLSENEKRNYEKYLSEELVGQVGRIAYSPWYNLGILQDVIKSGKITQAQAGELMLTFEKIAFETQEVSNMGYRIGRLESFNDDRIVSINNEYRMFFMRLNIENEELKLSNEQIITLKKMEELMKKYQSVVSETFDIPGEIGVKGTPSEFLNIYREKGISDDYWVELLIGFNEVTDMTYKIYFN